MTKKKLFESLEAFLETKVPCGSGGGWAKVSDEEFEKLYELFYGIVEAKYSKDADGDIPIQVKLVNRNTHEKLHYFPVPYGRGDKLSEAAMSRAIMTNISIATESMRRAEYFVDKVMKEEEAKDRYYLKWGHMEDYEEVSKERYVEAERAAGFISKFGPEHPATAGFSKTEGKRTVHGKIVYGKKNA